MATPTVTIPGPPASTSSSTSKTSGSLASFGGKPVVVPKTLLKQCSPYNDPCHCFVLQQFSDATQAIILDYVRRVTSTVSVFQ